MSHTHIGKEDWSCIARMLKAGHGFSEIARTLGKHPSALSRHVRAHGEREGYDVREVRRTKRMKRIAAMKGIRVVKSALLRFVTQELQDHKSPEQISGILARRHITLAASTIYRYLNERAPHLKRYLRSHKGKYRRRRGAKQREKAREEAKKRRIDERPDVVIRRGRIGDFEGDTLMGRDKRVRIVSFVDRRSGYLIAFLLPKMNARLLTDLALSHFRRIAYKKRKTITFDNGTEFSDWERLEARSGMTVYFAYPYHAWERGTNENTNGLLRQYLPKSLDFNTITPGELACVVRKLNRRERKRLKFLSPETVFRRK
ncbi:IS30 family transposase [Patescibacteria group bacterium]|nr:MAG: IS30 family transposase [Patescibacteria group bacterium]